jgi:hypothetical protein
LSAFPLHARRVAKRRFGSFRHHSKPGTRPWSRRECLAWRLVRRGGEREAAARIEAAAEAVEKQTGSVLEPYERIAFEARDEARRRADRPRRGAAAWAITEANAAAHALAVVAAARGALNEPRLHRSGGRSAGRAAVPTHVGSAQAARKAGSSGSQCSRASVCDRHAVSSLQPCGFDRGHDSAGRALVGQLGSRRAAGEVGRAQSRSTSADDVAVGPGGTSGSPMRQATSSAR